MIHGLLVAHFTPAMSVAMQLLFHSPLCRQSKTEVSFPEHSKSSSTKLSPDGAVPYKSSAIEDPRAAIAEGNPSILHITLASLRSNAAEFLW